MNKTININLGGVFFHIDESAYKKLKKYLDAIRKSLSDDPKGKDEILTDIESRIGEILAETVKDVRQVVNEQDIESIIEVMGKPEDYVGDEEYFEEQSSGSTNSKRKSKKLYRDTNDKFLGGVSSGLAHYFDFDVIWVRLAWLILFFGGGIGGLIYIILWILLPEANSTAEKLEMEGEPVNISNIEKKIREEFSNASQIVKDGIDDVSNHIKKGNYQSKVKSGSQEIVSLFGKVFSTFFKVVGKFIGILLIFVAGITLIALLVTMFSTGVVETLGVSSKFVNYPEFFYHSRLPLWVLVLFFVIALGIPFIVLFMLGLKIISSGVRTFSRTTKLSLLGVWLVALLGFIFVGIETGANYANENTVVTTEDIALNTTLDTLKIKMIAKDDFSLNRNYNEHRKVYENDKEMFYGTNIRFDIKESETDKAYIKIYKKSSGISYKAAKEKANQLSYNYKVVDGNLILNAYYLNELKNRFSNQKVKLVLYVPKNKTIYLHKSTKLFLHYVDNVQDVRDRDMTEHYYKMTENGLDCLDCEFEEEVNKETKSVINKIEEIKKETDSIEVKTSTKKINKHVREGKNGLEIN